MCGYQRREGYCISKALRSGATVKMLSMTWDSFKYLPKYWVLPQHSFLVFLSSLQFSKISKHGKSAVAEIGNWETLEHPA